MMLNEALNGQNNFFSIPNNYMLSLAKQNTQNHSIYLEKG